MSIIPECGNDTKNVGKEAGYSSIGIFQADSKEQGISGRRHAQLPRCGDTEKPV